MCRWFSATSFCKKKNTQGHDVLNVTAFTSQSSRSKADDERTSDMLSVRETETSTLNNNHHCDLRKLHTNLCCWYCGYAIALFCFFRRQVRRKKAPAQTHTHKHTHSMGLLTKTQWLPWLNVVCQLALLTQTS